MSPIRSVQIEELTVARASAATASYTIVYEKKNTMHCDLSIHPTFYLSVLLRLSRRPG